MTLLSAKKFETASMVGAIISKYLHSVSIVLERQILEHEKVPVMISSCFSKYNHTCLQNNSSETDVVFADFDVLFFQLLRQKKEEIF